MRTHDRPLLALWHAAVALFRHDIAVTTPGGRSATFAEIDTASDAIADTLRARGLQPGDTIGVSLRRGPTWVPVVLGIWKAGGVYAPMAGLADAARQDLMRRTRARVQMVDPPQAPPHADTGWLAAYVIEWHDAPATAAPAPAAAAGVIGPCHAYVMPTSGSSGRPKLALITHRTSAAVLSGLTRIIGIAPGERALHTASFSFSSSIRQMFVPLFAGAALTVLEHDGPFAPDLVLRTADGVGVTSLDLTPSQIAGLIQVLDTQPDAPRPSALQRLLVASEVLTPALLARWRRAVAVPHRVFHLYGQTESGGAISAGVLPDRPDADIASLPLALPCAPFTPHFCAGPDGAEAEEMCLEGFDAADGLLTAEGVDRSRYERTLPDADGRQLYSTGDLFVRDASGVLFFRGRAEAELKIRGRRVDTAALEREVAGAVALDRVVVAAVAVAGEGEGDGTVLCVGYVASDPIADEDIVRAATAHLDPDLPRPRVVRLDHMPTTRSGKVDRPAVAELMRTTLTQRLAATEDLIERVWNKHTLGHQPAAAVAAAGEAGHDFFATGGDSLTMIALLADVARVCGVRVLPQQFQEEPTLAGLRRIIGAAAPPALESTPSPAPRRVNRDTRPATTFQRGLWLTEQLAATPVSRYWLPIGVEVAGPLDPARLQRALRATVRRFDVLRAAFAVHDDTLLIMPEAIDPASLDVQMLDTIAEPALRGLGTLTTRPLVRLGVGAADGRTALALRVHHAIADRPSLELILATLCRCYDGDGEGGEMPREAPSGLDAMASTEHEGTATTRAEAQRFWHECLPAPMRRTMTAGPPSMARTRLTLEASSASSTSGTTGTNSASGTMRSTRHAAWLSAYHRALVEAHFELAGVVGVDIDVRPADTPDLVGPFVNALPIILDSLNGLNGAAPDPGSDVQASAAIAKVLAHARVPIGDVVPPARRPTGQPRQPFFLYKLVYQKAAYPTLCIGGFPTHYVRLPTGIAEHDMTLFVREASGRIDLELAWNTGAIAAPAAQAVLAATVARITGRKALSA